MPLAPTAPLLAALLTPGLLFQDAAVPPAGPPTPADAPAETAPEPADEHGTIVLPPTGGERRTADRADLEETEKLITELTNEFREKNDLKPVARDETLAEAAEKFGAYLAQEGVFGHRAGGTKPAERVAAAGYDYCTVRENLAYHFDTFGFQAEKLANESVTGWINSPGHRANLLADDVTETGVGVVHDAKSGRYFAVQLFGLPASAAVKFEVENRTEVPQTYRIGEREYTLPPRYVQTHKLCTPGAVTVDLGPAPPAAGEQTDAENADADSALKLSSGQVLILRPGPDGGVDPEIWSPPEEEETDEAAAASPEPTNPAAAPR
ncbi:CAP domain-containing protein [Alienimonas sp. DA493]|uniref:CAP domain-containing protein n=1 Tax=Alienimonas sp. DA493 TaxID=3373605 RepID=UPI0037550EEA